MTEHAKKSKGTILVFCGHNDDQIIGAGATLSQYVKEGYTFKTIIFSYGRTSHPHLPKETIKSIRVEESVKSDRILGGSGISYFDLDEGKMLEQIKEKRIKDKIKFIIQKEKPVKIFTHSIDDPHPDHRAVHNVMKDISDEISDKCEIWTFDVWNFWSIKSHLKPKLVVDATQTFKTKMQALREHQSQKAAKISLTWSIYYRAILNGWEYGYRYAEVFYKI